MTSGTTDRQESYRPKLVTTSGRSGWGKGYSHGCLNELKDGPV